MAYNGSGTFNLYTPGNPVVTGTTISSTWANNTLSDIATGLSTAITKDGQTTITATIPFTLAASAIFGTTHKVFVFNDGTYFYLTNTASGAGDGFRVSQTEVALMVNGGAVQTNTTTEFSTSNKMRIANALAIPAGGTDGQGYTATSTANFGTFFGSGVPTLSAAKGSLYLRSDGSTTNDRAYINTNGTTGWTALTTAA